MTDRALTPYDTGARMEPKLWVSADDSSEEESRRPATVDDYGRVDFDEFDATVATVWMEPDGAGGCVLHISTHTGGLAIQVDGHRLEVIR